MDFPTCLFLRNDVRRCSCGPRAALTSTLLSLVLVGRTPQTTDGVGKLVVHDVPAMEKSIFSTQDLMRYSSAKQ